MSSFGPSVQDTGGQVKQKATKMVGGQEGVQGMAEGSGFIWPGEEGDTIAVFSCQVGVTRRSQTLLGDVQSEAHFAAGGSPTRHKGEKGKKPMFPVRAVKPWERLSRVVEFPFWEMFKA